MVKPKKKTQQRKEAAPKPEIGESTDHASGQSEEALPPAHEKTDEEFLQKYTGENNQAIWFRNIIRAQCRQVMQETIAEEVEKTTTDIRLQLKKLQEKVEQLNEELAWSKTEINKLKYSKDGINKELAKKTREIEKLKEHHDHLEQKQRETRVRITGIAEEENENLTKKIMKLAKNKMGLKKMKESEISQIHRSGKKKASKTRDVVVQFEHMSTRDSFHGARKKLQSSSGSDRAIYINDDLTEFRLKLLYDARMLVKRNKLKGAWSQHGNVMVLPTEGGPKPVYNHQDLRLISGLDYYGDSDSDDIELDDQLDMLSNSSI